MKASWRITFNLLLLKPRNYESTEELHKVFEVIIEKLISCIQYKNCVFPNNELSMEFKMKQQFLYFMLTISWFYKFNHIATLLKEILLRWPNGQWNLILQLL